MADVHALLLVPPKRDPKGLLREGPCGARPPNVHWTTCPVHGRSALVSNDKLPPAPCPEYACGPIHTHEALVLAWDGQPVDEGIDRAVRVLGFHRSHVYKIVMAHLGLLKGPENLLRWLRDDSVNLGTLIRLDEDGKEISDS